MPPRSNNKKKGRGKGEKKTKVQKQREKDNKNPEVQRMLNGLKADGCSIIFKEDGSTIVSHPCMNPDADKRAFSDWGLLNMEDRRIIVDNYIHNYEDDLRKGVYEGTKVITSNLACQHLGPMLCEAFLEEEIQTDMLCFLSKCNKKLCSVVKQKGALSPEYQKLPSMWIDILTLIMEHGPNNDIRLTFAKSIEPLVTCMIDEKRELFQSKEYWYTGLTPFFCLVHNIMLSDEGRSVMLSYDKLLPFIAQAACWRVSRDDIVNDAIWLKRDASVSAACYDAQGVLDLVLDESEMISPLNLIASTPLFNDDPKCNVSIIVGFIRMMSNEKQNGTAFLKCIIDNLVVNDKVDGQVIAELIQHGINDSSSNFSMRMMLVILGLDDDNDDIQMSDSRFAVSIQNGLIDLLVANEVDEQSTLIAEALCEMSMHKRTSRALREKRSEISSVLDTAQSAQSSSTDIVSLIKDSIELGTSSTCCNCLKQFDRGSLYFCSGCNVECYCSLSCQSESWKLGHDKACKDISNHSDYLRCQGVSETDVKRYESLQNNVTMAGCRIIQQLESNTDGKDVVVDFGQCPASTTLIDKENLENSRGLKCTFISPVMYSFAKDELVIDKVIAVKDEARVPQDKSFSDKLSGFLNKMYSTKA